jgi:hypothetical protein
MVSNMYFSMFPKIDYDLLGNGTTNRFTNITKRAFISNHVRKNIVNFDFYDVVDGESPEIIADLYYKNVYLHWIVLLSNDIVNVYDQWPKSLLSLENYINDKYDDPFGVHHYTINQSSGDTTKKIIITDNTFYPNADVVSNYQYESDLNDDKRRIRLIQRQYVEQIILEYRYVLKDR